MKEKIRYYINYKMKERVESIFEGISNGRKKALNSWFEDQWIKIDSIKKSLILMTESKESFTELLVELKERYQTFIELFILDEHGDIIASSFARHIGDNIKEFPNFKKGLAGECYMYGPYCDKKTLDLDLTGKPFYDEVTLLFSAPYKNNDQVRILCVRVLNDDMSNVIQEEDTHVYKDSGDNYLFMIQNNRGIETGTAISRSRFEDKTFTKGDNLKDGIKTKKWGEVKIKEHTEFEILFSDPATNSLHQGVQYTINNKENLDCGPGYPDYRHILVGGKGTIITPPHSDEVWGMMCEGDIADIYHFTSLSSKLSMQIGMITLVTTIILELFHSYVKSMVRIGDIFLWLITFLGAYLITKYTVVKPMVKTINLLRTIAEGEGDLTKRVDVQRSNEIGELARWFNKFVSNQMNMIKRIKTSIKTTKGTTKQVSKSSKKIEESINIIGETVTTLSKHSIEQNKLFKNTQHEVKKIANTFEKNEELELLINDIMNKTDSTNQAAATASSVKEEVMINISDLETSMVNAISNISSLESKSNEITKIISTITEISDQTNLLALNATIEAARAGEVGKGFSVVADEIKKLSTDTYHATFMVTELVSSIQSEIKNTNQNIEAIDEKVKASIKSSKESAEAVELVIQVSNTISYILNIMREQNNVIKEVQHNIFEMAKQSEESTVIGEMNSNHALESVEDIMKQVGKLNQVLESLEYSAEDLDKMVGAFVVHVKDN